MIGAAPSLVPSSLKDEFCLILKIFRTGISLLKKQWEGKIFHIPVCILILACKSNTNHAICQYIG